MKILKLESIKAVMVCC